MSINLQRDRALTAAQQFAARGELDKAIREYQSVVEQDSNDVQTWVLLADTLHRAGEVDAAVERYAHAANVLLDKGEVPSALQIFRQVLNLAPERYDIHLRTGQAFERLRRYPEAVALYEKVAGVYLRGGNTREALLLYERVADLMPREVAKRLRLAELFSRERRVEEAIQHFQIGAEFLRQTGRSQEFVRVAERLLYHRQLDDVIRELVRVYLEIDQPRRALMKLNELLQRKQDDAEGLELLAATFVRLGKGDKAVSVVLELVKTQRGQGSLGVARSVRALRGALGWAPTDPQLRKILDELIAEHGDIPEQPPVIAAPVPEPEPEPDPEVEEYDDFDDFEEIEEIDELEEPSVIAAKPAALEPVEHRQPVARPTTQPMAVIEDEAPIASRRHSLTQEVISEGAQASAEHDSDVDFDKQLEEIRVLMKYHLFEHALGHAEQIIQVDPHHQQGLELIAEIYAALGRNDQAADTRTTLARRLLDRDPATAARHIELALALIPNHRLATELGQHLSEVAGVSIGIADRDAESEIDPLAGLELDDDIAPAVVQRSVLDREALDTPKVGNTFDSAAHPAPDPLADLEIDESMLGESSGELDIRSADPRLHGELNSLAVDDDFAISVDHDGDQVEPEQDFEVEDRFGLGGDDDDSEASAESSERTELVRVRQGPGEFGVPEAEIENETTSIYATPPTIGRIEPDLQSEPEPELEPEPVAVEPEPVTAEPVAVEPEPVAVASEPEPEQDWPDLSAELDELQFYLAQDLEDDARAAYDDLVELFPGHPELAKLAPRFGGVAATPPTEAAPADQDSVGDSESPDAGESLDAAAPLLELDDDDGEDDDFLAGIFDEEAPRPQKKREVAIQTHEVEGADAGDRFDLGTAYREMGLIEKALVEYEIASRDPRWQAKALTMMGALRRQSGDDTTALGLFVQAVAAARTKDERCEANYELAMVYLVVGQPAEAKQALERVDAGYRDRDQKLTKLG